MKFCFILISVSLLHAAASVYSQTATITIENSQASISDIFTAIEQQTEYKIFYKNDQIDVNRPAAVKAEKMMVKDALSQIFRNSDCSYTMFDRLIVVTPKRELLQQGIVVTGVVKDEAGELMPGVNVVVKGTIAGAVADANGKYSINVPNKDALLVFSFVGYLTQEAAVGEQRTIDVTLMEDTKQIEEVVVVGYGTMKRRDMIGSTAKITGSDITKIPVTSIAQSMQGLASGVFISNNSGHPGAAPQVLIRGKNSINLGTGPLWVIDGVPMITSSSELTIGGVKGVSAISMLNPNDIESIEVLKDAAATSIYGNRASGGVILVTTKSNKGKLTGLSINYDGGISRLPFKQNDIYVDTKDWWKMIDEGWANAGNTNQKDPNSILAVQWLDPVKPTMTKEESMGINTDHLDALTQLANFQQIGFTANKGFETGGVLFSLNYRDEDGVLRNNKIERLTGRFSFNFSPICKLNIGINANFQYLNNEGVPSGGAKGSGGSGWFSWSNLIPWYKLYDSTSQTGYWYPNSGFNVLASSDRNLIRNDTDMYRTISNAFIKWDTPLNGLSIKGEVGVDLMITNSSYWRSILLSSAPYQSEASEQSITKHVLNYDAYLNYEKTFGKHVVNVTAGAEAVTGSSYYRKAEGKQIYSTYPELINPLQKTTASGGSGYDPATLGVFGRFNYKFNDRYITNFSIRRDGHGALSEENRWATFMAVGAGWIISEEEFINIPLISLLKLRASYGQTGNTGLNRSMTRMNWGMNGYQYGTNYLPGATTLGPMGNAGLKWETTTNLDLGFDFGILKNRISGSMAYYTQKMTDLILSGNVPISTGFDSNQLWKNVGDMKNWGWEFNISSVNIDRQFKWQTDINYSFNNNKITGLNEFEKGKGAEYARSIRKEGEKIDTWYMANYAYIDSEKGIPYMEQRDNDKWNNEYVSVSTGKYIPMNLKNTDANKMVQSGKSPLPTFYGGITNTFFYKGFDLNILFTFAGGHYLVNQLYYDGIRIDAQRSMPKDLVGNYWQNPGDNAKFWRLAYNYLQKYDDNGNPSATGTSFDNGGSNYYLEKADYMKLRNLQLGYTLPNSITGKIKLHNVRFYIGGTNLLTITGFKGLDPETNNELPVPRTINFGLSLNL